MDPFDLNQFLPYQLNRLAETVSKAFQECYQRDFGLTRTQWRILAHLAAEDGMTARDIAAQIHEDKVSLSRGVVALEARALLRREADTADRRFERLHLTESGCQLFAEVATRARSFEQTLALRLGPALMSDLQTTVAEARDRLAGGEAIGAAPA